MLLKEYFPCEIASDSKETVCAEEIGRIYEKIEDDVSRHIFENRLLYSLTGDYGYIGKIVSHTEPGRQMEELLQGEVYIYGAGRRGKLLVETFGDKHWQGFIDADREGFYMGYPVCKMRDFIYRKDTRIIISNRYGYDEIRETLIRDKKVPEDKIIVFEHFSRQVRQNRYFEPMCLKKYSMQNKLFMDLGCYDGEDTVKAIRFFGKEEFTTYALEPDRDNYVRCADILRDCRGVTLINQGIGKRKEKKYFTTGSGEGARFSDQGDVLAEINTIDNIVKEDTVGFIKMDIEGYEEEALLGGAEAIKRCKPVLAVCIYHKRTDVWKLPSTILKLNPDYRFFFGHYTLGWGDTVLYAVDPGALV